MMNYTPTKFVLSITQYIDEDVENCDDDKIDYINSKTKSLLTFADYIFDEVWEGMGLNSLPDYVSHALKCDINSYKNNDGIRWLRDYMINDLSVNYESENLVKKGNEMGISKTIWSTDNKVNFDEPHDYPTAKYIKNGNQHCCNEENKKHSFEGKTWGDLWKAYDKVRGNDECGHCFIEGFELKDDTIIFHCGS